jgi:hypothetical protein
MNSERHVCNYAILWFLPTRAREEFVNVGVLVNCLQPCFLDFELESPEMPRRVRDFFPDQNEMTFEANLAAMRREFERVKEMTDSAQDPTSCMRLFREVVRPRESIFRFGEIRTRSTSDPATLTGELFRRYVRMEPKESSQAVKQP